MSTSYTQMTSTVTSAIKGELASVDKWRAVGQPVHDYYGTQTALEETKAQFIADAIIPALKPVHQKALERELCRKGSTEYNEMDEGQKANWETANQAKKDARAIAHTMFTRVVRYAFPADKKERTVTALKTRLQNELASLIKACEKSEGEDFDVAGTINNLRATLAFVNK
jgi:replicative DNA helicase